VSQALTDDNCAFPMMISPEALARFRQPGSRTRLYGVPYRPTRYGW
jgi:hypothetical protein